MGNGLGSTIGKGRLAACLLSTPSAHFCDCAAASRYAESRRCAVLTSGSRDQDVNGLDSYLQGAHSVSLLARNKNKCSLCFHAAPDLCINALGARRG